jgi:hypothetical protein
VAEQPEQESAADTIRDLKRQEPFVPFRIVMSSGEKYLIDDPDALAITTNQLHYFPPRKETAIHMRFNQISSVEVGDGKTTSRRKAS